MNNELVTFAFLPNIGWTEALVLIFLFVLLFGAKKLPELARGLGKSIKEFKKATSSIEDDIRDAMDEEPKKPAANPKPLEKTENTVSKD